MEFLASCSLAAVVDDVAGNQLYLLFVLLFGRGLVHTRKGRASRRQQQVTIWHHSQQWSQEKSLRQRDIRECSPLQSHSLGSQT